MIENFPENSRALLLTFRTNCPNWSTRLILLRSGPILPTIPPQTLFFTQKSQNPFWDMYTHKIPSWTPPQIRPSLWPELESEQNELPTIWANWANWTPTGQNVWKVDKTYLEVGNLAIFFNSFFNSGSSAWTVYILCKVLLTSWFMIPPFCNQQDCEVAPTAPQ